MSKYISNNTPLRSDDKRDIKNFPIDYRYIVPVYNMVPGRDLNENSKELAVYLK